MKITHKKTGPKYVARPNSPITNKQAAIVGAELESMDAIGVRKTPSALLERARDRRSPLHTFFEWDDTVAGEKYRISQAREFIASVMVIESKQDQRSRAFYSVNVEPVTGGPGRSYEPRSRVLVDDEAMTQVGWELFLRLRAAAREARSLGLEAKSSFWRQSCALLLSREPESKPVKAAEEAMAR